MSSLLRRIKVVKLETTEFRNQSFGGADFSRQAKPHLRAFDCEFIGCKFDEAALSDFRSWGSHFINCTFHKTNLRNAAIGGVDKGKLNHFERVDFSQPDMRGIASGNGAFTDCLFDRTRLDKVAFGGSQFIRCTFRGILNEVTFNAHAFRGEAFPPNTMEDVDFSGAELHWVDFRKLDLDTVRFPHDKDHLVLDNYVEFLKEAVFELKGASEVGLRQLRAVLEHNLKWVGSRQIRGVLRRNDFSEFRPGALEKFDELVVKFGRVSPV
ncbi:MAG TPA: pentapeptide repeat-containing protein [Candidatus Angelobacter sp.]|nr:pentapeptide repeat-containing protein [Candidatus Angelobacter sp.]